ncbi:uncharacterized protein LOC108605079 [Drosophila busckii]|nr:uncharacterized protein LOC108605079 [Drosophila busckii]
MIFLRKRDKEKEKERQEQLIQQIESGMQLERQGNVYIWWLPTSFCQSRHGPYKQNGSNSCTLISLLLASGIAKQYSFSSSPAQLPERAFLLLDECINGGNLVSHDRIKANLNTSIPDAMSALRSHPQTDFGLEEWFFVQLRVDARNQRELAQQVARACHATVQFLKLGEGWAVPSHLFGAMVSDGRTVILSLELSSNVATLMDTHKHGQKSGALLVQSTLEQLEELMLWFIIMQRQIFGGRPSILEVSFISSLPTLALLIPPTLKQMANKICPPS